MHSAIYTGEVMHRRLGAVPHRFTARVDSLFLDLDEVPALDRELRLFSHNRPNVYAFYDRDHGPRDGSSLRAWAEHHLARAGIDLAGGSIRLLCFPRQWGYVFNPLSVWFCYHRDDTLRAVIHEVSNTFGDRHGYLIPTPGHAAGRVIRQRCAKVFHVSPFMPMSGGYTFRLREPGRRFTLAIHYTADAETDLIATQTARYRPLGDRTLLAALATHPLMTSKVMSAIHWHALRLWRKGATFHRRPEPPAVPVSIVQPAPAGAATPDTPAARAASRAAWHEQPAPADQSTEARA